jgi:hypothetical protein
VATVGIIANPAAGKDIRRLVAHGRVVSDQEKVNILRRMLVGLDATGIDRLVIMPDSAMLGRAAIDEKRFGFETEFLDMTVFNAERDSAGAARLMAHMGVDCLITLGGDGTNRAVSLGSGNVPIVAVSTGTNNVFPDMVEGTVAGLAAGVVAAGLVDREMVTAPSKRIEAWVDGALADVALIDLAVSRERFVGARAIWDIDTVHEVFLTQTAPGNIGMSAIGFQLHPEPLGENEGIHLVIGPGGPTVRAAIAPGAVAKVRIESWRAVETDERVSVDLRPCTVALDGERSFAMPSSDSSMEIGLTSSGPRVVDVDAAIREAARAGVFTDRTAVTR